MTTSARPTTDTSNAPVTTAHKSEEVSQRLLRLRDELIVRHHLAGMELKAAVHELMETALMDAVLKARGNKVVDDIAARLTKLGVTTSKTI